jgi:hypothetical protein
LGLLWEQQPVLGFQASEELLRGWVWPHLSAPAALLPLLQLLLLLLLVVVVVVIAASWISGSST